MKLFAFSDLHGDVEALKRMLKSVEDESFNYILIAGDLTGIDVEEPEVTVKQAREIFGILEGFDLPYYFVWGFPFRENCLYFVHRAFIESGKWEVEKGGDLVNIVSKASGLRCVMPVNRYEAVVKVLEVVSALRFR